MRVQFSGIFVNFESGRAPDTRYADARVQSNNGRTARGDLPNLHVVVAAESNNDGQY